MKSTSVLRAQSVVSLRANVFGNVPVFDLVDAVKERYGFRVTPSTEDLLNPQPNKPATFVAGKFRAKTRSITIENLQVLNFPPISTSVSAITRTSTDDSDLLLTDLETWVSAEFGIDCTNVFPRTYQSHLEVIITGSLAERLFVFKSLGDAITNLLKSYGFSSCPTFEPIGMSMYFDTTKQTAPPTLATPFTFERRAAAGYEENKYFSQAPLRTDDHIAVLTQLEQVLAVN